MGEAISWRNAMCAHYLKGDCDEAEDAAEMAEGLYNEIQDDFGVAELHFMLAELHNAIGRYNDAVKSAKKSLTIFNRLPGSGRWVQRSLQSLVKANLGLFQFDDAMDVAKDTVNSLKKQGKTRWELISMVSILSTAVEQGNEMMGLRVGMNALSMARAKEKDDKELHAILLRAIAKAHLVTAVNRPGMQLAFVLNHLEQATSCALDAARLFSQLGDEVNADTCRQMRDEVNTTQEKMSSNKILQAEQEDSRIVDSVVEAIQNRDGEALERTAQQLPDLKVFTQEKFEELLLPVLEKEDYDGCSAFLTAHRAALDESTARFADRQKRKGLHFGSSALYVNTRLGGMGYGPHFQVMTGACRAGLPGGTTFGVLLEREENTDTWLNENLMGGSPAIMDAALQVQMGMGPDITREYMSAHERIAFNMV